MAQPFLQSNTKLRRILKLLAFLYFLWQIRKLIRKLRALSNPKHSQIRSRNPMVHPSINLFPQYFESSNKSGLWIFHRDWVIPNFLQLELNLNHPKGVVIISHGLAEHVQRYEHLAQELNKSGFACYGIDHQGHGLSDGDKSYVEKFKHYVNDLLYFSQGVADQYEEYQIPVFLLGHSMGGLIAAYAALKSQQNKGKKFIFDGGVILSSPFFGIAPQSDIGSKYAIVDNIVHFVSKHLPKLQCLAVPNKGLSHDPAVFYRLQRDVLHHTDMVCIRTVQELVDAGTRMVDVECKKVEYPYLLFGGGDDPICNANKWKVFHDHSLSEDKELIVFEGLFHECLNETEPHQKKVIEKIIEWLGQRCQVYEYDRNGSSDKGIKGDMIEQDIDIDVDVDDDVDDDEIHPFDD